MWLVFSQDVLQSHLGAFSKTVKADYLSTLSDSVILHVEIL